MDTGLNKILYFTQPNLIFVGKGRAYPSGALTVPILSSESYSRILDSAKNTCQWQ
jgi:hypothetical protein